MVQKFIIITKLRIPDRTEILFFNIIQKYIITKQKTE